MQKGLEFVYWFGLDVSKKSFTAARRSVANWEDTVFPQQDSYTLNKTGVKAFLNWAESIRNNYSYAIAMETTGTYSAKLRTLIKEENPQLHVAICNARQISLYARSFTEQKTDKADAEMIAKFAAERHPAEPRPMTSEEGKLREVVRQRDRLVDAKLRLTNSRDTLQNETVLAIVKPVIDSLEQAIQALEKEIEKIVNASEKICKDVDLMTTVPGVGILSAACIYAEFGSLKNYTRDQISALSGVCPVQKQSGTSVNKHSMSHKGPRLTRRILYLDVQQTIKKSPQMSAFQARLLERPNSSKMTARCACMRKLLLILRALIISGKAFDVSYVSSQNNQKSNATACVSSKNNQKSNATA